ncbi:MAG: anthranilate phosphoribosyltransferase [Clostridia bacterium]|nr:anthranilate phosphoribosyltransferase [Clostridia bacterium]
MIKESIKKLANCTNISREEAYAAMEEIMSGQATPSQISAFITALAIKGETVDEISGCAAVMDQHAERVTLDKEAVDIVGTGGDGVGTFNISTCASFVTAAAGLPVAKHGNRSVSSKCGSADVLEALGVTIALTPEQARECFRQTDLCFMFAPGYHKSMKHAAGPRKELGIRSIFNILGPITNPARAPYRLLGVYSEKLCEPLVHVMVNLGIKGVLAVCSHDGLDEISISAPTTVCEAKNGNVVGYLLHPERLGLKTYPLSEVIGGDAQENAAILLNVLKGEKGARRDIVLINAAAALYAASVAPTLKEGVRMASQSIDSGAALLKLYHYRDATNRMVEAAV